MESYHKVFDTIFVTGKYDISFSIGSRIRDGQYVGVRINNHCYSINFGYMEYFAFTPKRNNSIINQRSQTLLTLEKGCYSVSESEVIFDLVYRSCGTISESKLQHYMIIGEEAILDIVVSQEPVFKEEELDLQLENDILKYQGLTLEGKMPDDNYYFFTLYSTSVYKVQFYLLGLNNGIKVELDSMPAFYMIEEGVDLTGSSENIVNQILLKDSTNQYLHRIQSQNSKKQPNYCLYNLLDYNIYFYSEDIPKPLSFPL